MSYGVGSDMNYADMILDSVGVANLDEVNLSYMIVSVVIFQKFTWLYPRLVEHVKNNFVLYKQVSPFYVAPTVLDLQHIQCILVTAP